MFMHSVYCNCNGILCDYVYIYMCVCVCVCMYACMYVCMYVYYYVYNLKQHLGLSFIK